MVYGPCGSVANSRTCPEASGSRPSQRSVMSVGDTRVAVRWIGVCGGVERAAVSRRKATRAALIALPAPELDAAPPARGGALAAPRPVGAELVVEAAALTRHGVLQRPVDVGP